MGFWSVLRRPNKLQDLPDSSNVRGITWYFTNTRGQIQFLHTIAVLYVIVFCFLVCWASVTLGLPLVFEDSPTTLKYAQAFMIYLCFFIESNYILLKLRAKDSHVLRKTNGDLPIGRISNVLNENQNKYHEQSPENEHERINSWTQCSHCNIQVPPRARHCSICQTCVLKKDHHCFFTGCCIGFYNQRYFIRHCFLGIIGGTWGLYNLGTYLSINYAAFFSFQVYKYFLPYCVLSAMLGYVSIYEVFLVLLFYCHITSTATSFYYFWWQLFIILRGQTSYEFMKKKRLYKDDFWPHMRSVFGPYWGIGFLFPISFMKNEGDGKTWQLNSKNM
ncbi:probable palmitoyltransferase ZDHHC24 [Mya arenaria]|uniref:probable palmitoyltransferase ZDHHC24 n=1 Tax=Mya arenaria TaxID=6604 RepID=UPI0022E221FD|nr:probable palmitoyltransferase ZDHHC24 [Mya arenaria]XP_052764263.1 probable palmitoyltransferase ZDHHC24 [Mya arenaria]XP_052764264.1 probable palmitoyltransferase ZDHHC24 [Mya arenaria]XP_052764265.1 probable palmitoyltransferase ZDHHC24 [Mya arenaria]XP_052764266.1 probable palmitoyltransferase ZDHHC24 [Mya arenaria]